MFAVVPRPRLVLCSDDGPCHKACANRMGIWGTPGEPIPFLVGEAAELVTVQNVTVLSNTSMHHWHPTEQIHRSISSPHWHGVTNEVVQAAAMMPMVLDLDSDASNRRHAVWNHAETSFRKVASLWKPNERVVVSAINAASDFKFCFEDPSAIAKGATRGLLFCSTVGDRKLNVHESWDVVQVPLNVDEGRLLATLRLLPLVRETPFVAQVAIVNGYHKTSDVYRIFEEMTMLGIRYVACTWT